MSDLFWMRRALALAEKARPISPPNPAVGCVIVRDEEVLGEGFTQVVGSDHAEIQAIKDANARGFDVAGATVYVTLEPCSHYGRTPPCALRLLEEKVARVVIAIKDPNPKVSGRGVKILEEAGIAVSCGICEREAWAINPGFMTAMNEARPWVRLKVAMSLDGMTALANGESQWITGKAARCDGHRYRSYSGAILTGIGTVLADDPQMNVREDNQLLPRQPLKVVLDSHLKTPTGAKLFNDGKTLIVCAIDDAQKRAALEAIGAEVYVLPNRDGQVDLRGLMAMLFARGIQDVHVEAGATLNGALLEAGLVDEALIYVAPKFLGNGRGAFILNPIQSLSQVQSWYVASTDQVGQDVRVVLLRKEI